MSGITKIDLNVHESDLLTELNQIKILGGKKDGEVTAQYGCNTWDGCGSNVKTFTDDARRDRDRRRLNYHFTRPRRKTRRGDGSPTSIIRIDGDTIRIFTRKEQNGD